MTRLRSYAKINLGLRIGPVRANGFHALATVYQTVDAWDVVGVEAVLAGATSIAIDCEDPRVPCTPQNTAWKMVELALSAMAVTAAVRVTIEKRLPVQGGLGAGSANAAAALLGLERELAAHGIAPLPGKQRMEIAAAVGSDVPLFLAGGTSLGTGRGEAIRALADGTEHACVLAIPNVAVSTPAAFRAWDALPENATREGTPATDRRELTISGSKDRLEQLSRTVSDVWTDGPSGVFSVGEGLAWDPVSALVRTGIENDFERVVFPQHPLLRDLKAALAGDLPGIPSHQKAIAAMLSGSGASFFGLYADMKAAESAAERVRASGATALVTRTLGRERYWREMWE